MVVMAMGRRLPVLRDVVEAPGHALGAVFQGVAPVSTHSGLQIFELRLDTSLHLVTQSLLQRKMQRL